MNNEERLTLDPEEILSDEFEYIAQTAFQAHEDRARVTTFYLVTVGSLVAAILSAETGAFVRSFTYVAFAALFVMLSAMGVLTLLQLVRLRQAWFESIQAMNQMKDFFIKYVQDMPLGEAFRWRTETIPSRFKPWSVAYMLAFQIAMLGGVSLGSAIIFIGLNFDQVWYPWAIGGGLIFFALQMGLHRWLLRR